MAWRVVKVSELPLGLRVLRFGCKGRDVAALQQMLADAGFYFGPIDGLYGVLTEEAVILAERTFKLRVDGIAGMAVIDSLKRLAKRMGRIVYTVKAHDDLKLISQKFGVTQNAWEAFAGQGNPRKKLFPGMKLLLHEKALLTWGELEETAPVLITGQISPGGSINREGRLELKSDLSPNRYWLIGATEDAWELIAASRKKRNQLLNDLRKLVHYRFGLDLRNMRPELAGFWQGFLKAILHRADIKNLSFLVISFNPFQSGSKDPKRYLKFFENYENVRWLMVEPQWPRGSSSFEEAVQLYFKILPSLNRATMNKILPVAGTHGWEWNSSGERKVPYQEAKLVRALNYRSATYLPDIKYVKVGYLHRGEKVRLFYRDYQGWFDFLHYIKQYHFSGVVIQNHQVLSEILPELIADSFRVLPESKLEKM